MPLSLAGTLKDPYGKPLPSAVIRFDAVTTSSSVLNHISAEATTDATGAYAIQVEFGQYNIRVQSGRSFYELARAVQVNSDTSAATLNELIVDWQAESTVTPQIIVTMREIADETRGYRDEASASASAAATSEANADQSEAAALASQQAAATSEANAANSATAAATSEGNAAASASASLASEQAADQSESLAEQWATSQTLVDGVNYGAKKYALDASASQAAAAQSETNAATSETNAAGSASAALTSEQNADASESAALTSQQAAAASEANASTSETNAANSASAAATSETNAASSETSAAGSASAAATSEDNAAASETNAAGSASAAATSESNAAGSAADAQAALEQFRGVYYGPLASDPTADPNGDPPTEGDRYYNTTDGGERVFDGTSWVANDIVSHEQAADPHPQYVQKVTGKALSTNDYTDAEKSKLAGVESGATQNATNAQLRDRSTHTGTQPLSTISDAGTAAAANTGTGASDVPTASQADGRYARLTGANNFDTMPTVGGDPIVESGSNSDGEWTRWADGTQECKDIVSVSMGPNTSASFMYTAPQPILAGATQYFYLSYVASGNTLDMVAAYEADNGPESRNQISGFVRNTNTTSTRTIWITLLSKGPWK